MSHRTSVRIVEVGPRDGLQNESADIPTEIKVDFVNALARAGLRDIEISSFVSPKSVPRMADAADITRQIEKRAGTRYSVLIPNLRGLDRWLQSANVLPNASRGIALFTAASETFNQKNINASIPESLENFRHIVARLRTEFGSEMPFIRGYVSTAFRCPYEGWIEPAPVEEVAKQLVDIGVDELSFGDTVGAATPNLVQNLLERLVPTFGTDMIAMHFHDTRGTALANVLTSMELGIGIFDSSAAGLGGCPFAPGATGNLATEDLVYMLSGMEIETGVSLEGVVQASNLIRPFIGHPLPSRALQAFQAAHY